MTQELYTGLSLEEWRAKIDRILAEKEKAKGEGRIWELSAEGSTITLSRTLE